MSEFYKDEITQKTLVNDQSFLNVKDCLRLIENSEFKNDMIRLFGIEEIENEVIPIRGVARIVREIIDRDNQFEKIDFESNVTDVSCFAYADSKEVGLLFKDATLLDMDELRAKPIYNAKREFFEETYKLDKFADFCVQNDCFEIIEQNLTSLNKLFENNGLLKKSYRLLRDEEGRFYVRAITSVEAYNDYNIRFSLFVTLIALHKLTKNSSDNFEIIRCEFNESFIKLFVGSTTSQDIKGIGKMTFVLEMTNDEIKREAFKFEGLLQIVAEDGDEVRDIYLKPRSIKTQIVSIRHNFNPQTVIKYLSGLSGFINAAETEMKQDLVDFHNMEDVDQLRYVLLRKIEKSTSKELGHYKIPIRKQLDRKIHNASELLVLMGRVDELVTDLEVKEYLRYLFYDILREKRSN